LLRTAREQQVHGKDRLYGCVQLCERWSFALVSSLPFFNLFFALLKVLAVVLPQDSQIIAPEVAMRLDTI